MLEKVKNNRIIKDYLKIFIGSGLLGFAIKSAFDLNGLVCGGFSGFAIVVKALTEGIIEGGIPLWLTNLVLNIPVFVLGIKIKGLAFLKKTIFGTLVLSFWLYILPAVPVMENDMVLTVIFGAALQGVGMGLILLGKGSTGGTDLVAILIQHFVRHLSVAKILLFVDGAVVVLGAFVFGPQKALYAILAVVLMSKVTDGLMEGLNYAKAIYILSNKTDDISHALMHDLDRGLTGIHARGMYENTERMMLFCVVGQKQVVEVKEMVAQIDPKAFVIVTDAREVLGEGFIEEF